MTTKDENLKNIKFTKHALSRARARHLWKYVSKAKFWYDAQAYTINQVKLENCIYTYSQTGDEIAIITMYQI